jgi:4,4'-diapolycopenoate synthase
MKFRFLGTALGGLVLSLAPLVSAADLKVRVTSLLPNRGQLAYALFEGAEGFPSQRERAVRRGFLDFGASESFDFSIRDLPGGTYALAVYQDLDRSAKLEKNFLGIPREPVGFSRNPKLYLGPPKFDATSFVFDEVTDLVEVRMIH